jgi:putative transposase
MSRKNLVPLQLDNYYHIYNRGNNRQDLFFEDRNYHYFLQLYEHHVHPIADTFAYCLMPNHFHLLVRIKSEEELKTSQVLETCEVSSKPSQHFSNLFNAYAKAINKAYQRTGSLFEKRFGRIQVTSDAYFCSLVFYIHFNPQKHELVDDFRCWPWSSYNTLCTTDVTTLKHDDVLDWFGGVGGFQSFHRSLTDESAIGAFIDEDFD